MKDIYLLGSTGSIGVQTLDIIREHPEHFHIRALACGQNIALLQEQIEAFRPDFVSVLSEADSIVLQKKYPEIRFGFGPRGLIEAATMNGNHPGLLVNALVGIAGLAPTVHALEMGRDVALANKESLVVGGQIIHDTTHKTGAKIYCIDSEHSGIWQCLAGEDKDHIKRVWITSSGGAFRDLKRSELDQVTPEAAMNHPNWQMGAKITIDSATMMNKAFEIAEAHWLFDIDYDCIRPIMHRESIVHALVEFIDHSFKAHLSAPDMHHAISYALFGGVRKAGMQQPLALDQMERLSFSPFDSVRYPLMDHALRAYQTGHSLPAVLNAANEIAVSLFLKKKIRFLDIESIIIDALEQHTLVHHPTLTQLIMIDQDVKARISAHFFKD